MDETGFSSNPGKVKVNQALVYCVTLSCALAIGCDNQDDRLPTGTVASESAHRPDSDLVQPANDRKLEKVDFTLNNIVVRQILQDRSGTLWIGTNGNGVFRYDGTTLEKFSVNEGFGGDVVWRMDGSVSV